MRRFSEGAAVFFPQRCWRWGSRQVRCSGASCVLILPRLLPAAAAVPARRAGCTLRDRCARCAVGRLGRAVRRGRGVPFLVGRLLPRSRLATGGMEVGGARAGEIFVAGDGDGRAYAFDEEFSTLKMRSPAGGSGP